VTVQESPPGEGQARILHCNGVICQTFYGKGQRIMNKEGMAHTAGKAMGDEKRKGL
jgi:hypothetical protein